MSDLHRAVQDEIASFAPPAAPPFEAIAARKRARDRRRLAAGAGALGAVALATAVAVPALTGSAERLVAPGGLAAPGGTPSGEERPAPGSGGIDPGSPDGTSGGLVWTGATICLDGDACRSLGAERAQQLDAVLDAAVPAPAETGYCRAAGPTYTVRFEHPRARTVPITVRTVCGPMEQGGDTYLLDEPGQDRVKAMYREAADSPDDGGLPSARVTGLAVGDSTRITLAAPCGVPALLVDGVPYLATRYAAPGDSPPGWDREEEGRLRRIAADSMIFVADEDGQRIQFFAAPGRSLQGCPDQ